MIGERRWQTLKALARVYFGDNVFLREHTDPDAVLEEAIETLRQAPPHIRRLCGFFLFAFEYLYVIFSGEPRGFSWSQHPQKQKRYLERWQLSRFYPVRILVKLAGVILTLALTNQPGIFGMLDYGRDLERKGAHDHQRSRDP